MLNGDIFGLPSVYDERLAKLMDKIIALLIKKNVLSVEDIQRITNAMAVDIGLEEQKKNPDKQEF